MRLTSITPLSLKMTLSLTYKLGMCPSINLLNSYKEAGADNEVPPSAGVAPMYADLNLQMSYKEARN